jgi:hypothetical protein
MGVNYRKTWSTMFGRGVWARTGDRRTCLSGSRGSALHSNRLSGIAIGVLGPRVVSAPRIHFMTWTRSFSSCSKTVRSTNFSASCTSRAKSHPSMGSAARTSATQFPPGPNTALKAERSPGTSLRGWILPTRTPAEEYQKLRAQPARRTISLLFRPRSGTAAQSPGRLVGHSRTRPVMWTSA